MSKQITQTPNYVNAVGFLRLDFWNPDFDVLVDNKGYDVIWERAIPCPCSKKTAAHLSTCKNCLGSGWVFINPLQIKAVASSINKSTKFKEWGIELLGTASFTVKSQYHLNFMDKITMVNSQSPHSELKIVKRFRNKFIVDLTYPALSIVEVFKFEHPEEPLVLLSSECYSINKNFIEFFNGVNADDCISITYMHRVQYNIIDLNHDVRNTIILDNKSREADVNLPISAIGRRVHNVIDNYNFTGDNIIDNSYSL